MIYLPSNLWKRADVMNLKQILSEEQKGLVELCAEISEELNVKAYLVGGAVRDLFLKKKISDLDISIEGDGVLFAKALNQRLGGTLKIYDDFMTASITLSSLSQIDIITARKESYSNYGELPKVEAGDIYDDLKRRDFTINAIAIKIDKFELEVIDPLAGIKDIKNKQIRILHEKSFKEDPTRIFRAIRLAQRLNFRLNSHTLTLLKNAIIYLDCVSSARIKNEFIKIIKEGKTTKILRELEKHKITASILPGAQINLLSHKIVDKVKGLSKQEQEQDFNLHLTILLLIYWQCAKNKNDILKIKWDFTNKEKRIIKWFLDNEAKINFITNYPEHVTDLHLYLLLEHVPQEANIFLLSILEDNKKIIERIQALRNEISLPLEGKDLLQIGIAPGPIIGKILTELEEEVLRGNITSKKEAIEWVKLNYKS